ncbi:MAG TPA: ATPase domain-containing protein, partial [Lachnospiraceae bacterium]|nr:ATPase domain-containing protein [Lachnospiraceae bacterium]
MAKGKLSTVFYCSQCGYESAKWMGQCPACREWNTFVEETVSKTVNGKRESGSHRTGRKLPEKITAIRLTEDEKVMTHIEELDRVLGGGIVPGSLVLVGGDPGIGKSTLLLQVCKNLSDDGHQVLYISGEESLKQIKMRAERIGQFNDCLSLFCETNLSDIEEVIRREKPEAAVIDSIQTMFCEEVSSAPGSVSQ